MKYKLICWYKQNLLFICATFAEYEVVGLQHETQSVKKILKRVADELNDRFVISRELVRLLQAAVW